MENQVTLRESEINNLIQAAMWRLAHRLDPKGMNVKILGDFITFTAEAAAKYAIANYGGMTFC